MKNQSDQTPPETKNDDRPNVAYLTTAPGRPLEPAPPARVWAAWNAQTTVDRFRVPPGHDLTVVSVVRRGLQPVCAFAVRLGTHKGRVTPAAVYAACQAAGRPEGASGAERAYHLGDLPADHRTQLAVYLDAPAVHFDEVLVGGPLPLARIARMSVAEIVAHLCEENA